MSNQFVYAFGTTQVAIPIGNTCVPITPPAACIGGWLQWQSGGTLAICNQLAQAASAGFILGITSFPPMTWDGPAKFFLNAGGSTAVASIAWKFSSGYSLTP